MTDVYLSCSIGHEKGANLDCYYKYWKKSDHENVVIWIVD